MSRCVTSADRVLAQISRQPQDSARYVLDRGDHPQAIKRPRFAARPFRIDVRIGINEFRARKLAEIV
jgi:hypothetical protein